MKILVCAITYGRPISLGKLLESLQVQKINKNDSCEICIVDNDCTGNNDAVVERYQHSPYLIHYLKEPQKGIVFARNKAVDYFLNSKNDALVFIDDDEWAENDNWLENLIRAQRDSDADVVMGDVISVPETSRQAWIVEAMRPVKYQQNLQVITKFYTNNLLILKRVLEVITPAFDERFALTGSEDLHFSIKAKNAGFKAVYVNNAPVHEIFPATRSTMKWFMLRGFRNGSGAARAAIFESQGKRVFLKLIFQSAARFARGILTACVGIMRLNKGKIVLGVMRMASGIGTIAGMFGVDYEEYRTIHGH